MLSVLGVVIGVAALVSILSLIDGMEQYARDQITTTTSLKTILLSADVYKHSNGISIRKDSVSYLTYADFVALRTALSKPAKSYLFQRQAKEINLEGDTLEAGAHATGVAELDTSGVIIAGRIFTENEIQNASETGIVTESLAKTLVGQQEVKTLIGKKVILGSRSLTVIGVINLKSAQGPEIFFPFTALTQAELKNNPPQGLVEAEYIEDVPQLKDQVAAFLDHRFSGKHDYRLYTNELRVEQAAKGFQLFRIIMGLIVGISVLVGGIGVMNVLLISVTERTSEIGVRKAVGANKRDIILQFLSESITISFCGSMAGLTIGVLATMVIVPIVKSASGIPFQAAYTWNTLLVISILAIVIGVIFGTYPAIRASRLDPVEAIRRNE
jgi:putative ABC transport system permease protein